MIGILRTTINYSFNLLVLLIITQRGQVPTAVWFLLLSLWMCRDEIAGHLIARLLKEQDAAAAIHHPQIQTDKSDDHASEPDAPAKIPQLQEAA